LAGGVGLATELQHLSTGSLQRGGSWKCEAHREGDFQHTIRNAGGWGQEEGDGTGLAPVIDRELNWRGGPFGSPPAYTVGVQLSVHLPDILSSRAQGEEQQ